MARSSALTQRERRIGSGAFATALRVEQALLWLGLGAMVVATAAVLARPSAFDLPSWLGSDRTVALLGAMGIYALSHLLRFLRLALLIQSPAIRLRQVLQVHLLTTGLGVLLPFKLSELVRVREVGVITGSWRTGLLAVWLERAFDAAVLGVVLLIAVLGSSDSLDVLTPLLALMIAFVAVTVILIAVVPENVRQLMLHIVRRPFGEGSVGVLRTLRATLSMLEQAVTMLRGRIPTLVLLSTLIWAAELLVVSIAISGLGGGVSRLSAAVLGVLSGVSAGASPLMASSADRLIDALGELGLSPDVELYRGVLVLPALIAGVVAAGLYLPHRGRRT
jgi:hypothetical protein